MAAIPPPGATVAAGQASNETAMVLQAVNDASFVFVDCPSSAEAQAQITEASIRIIEQGFDAAMFTTDSINGEGLISNQYLKLVKQFTRHEDRQIRDGLLAHGISNNIIGDPGSATFADVIKFLNYLRSNEGQRVQFSEQQKAKLLRKAVKAVIPPPGPTIAAGKESVETEMVGQVQNDASFVILDHLSPAEAQAQIIEASARIIEQGFDATMFTSDAVYGAGLTTKQYLKLAKQLTMHEYKQVRDELLSHGISNNIIGKPDSATFADVVKFLYYLRSSAGQEVQYSVQQKAKLLRKVGDDQLVQEVSVTNFQPQMDDFFASQNSLLRSYNTKIVELRAEIARLESEREIKLTALRHEYRPASLFQEPSENELNLQCYAMYEAEGIKTGKVVLPRGDAGYKLARSLYSGKAIRDAKIAFLNSDPRHREQLYEYMRTKIIRLESEGQLKTAQKFRNLLKIAAGDEALIASDSLGFPAKGNCKRAASEIEATEDQGKSKRPANIEDN